MKIHVILSISFAAWAASAPAGATVPLTSAGDWKLSLSGFVAVDAIHDSTRSLSEIPQNSPVDRANSVKAQSGRTQFSLRSSRLAFTLDAPETDGWKAKGYIEMDFQGFDPVPGSATTSAGNTEASFFNNPTVRARQLYWVAENSGWQILAGHTWNVFGWQPYYFAPTAEMAPVSGMAYSRTAQLRAMKTIESPDKLVLQTAFAVARPPQRDASLPDFEAGVRVASNRRTAGFTLGATGAQKAQPMSVGLTGIWRQFRAPRNPAAPTGESVGFNGYAFAADAQLPLLASQDGNNVGNTLMLGGEFSIGRGFGDHFPGWTGNMSSPLSAATTASTAERNINLDAGIGGYDANDKFALIKLKSWNAYLQYHLAESAKSWLSAGYSVLSSGNIYNFAGPSGTLTNGNVPYRKAETYFTNANHDLSMRVRVAVEYAYMSTTYSDEKRGHNNRYQLNSYFLF